MPGRILDPWVNVPASGLTAGTVHVDLASFPGAGGVARKECRYTLFAHAQIILSIWSFTNLDMNAPRALNCAHQCFVSTHVSLYSWSTAVDFAGVSVLRGILSGALSSALLG